MSTDNYVDDLTVIAEKFTAGQNDRLAAALEAALTRALHRSVAVRSRPSDRLGFATVTLAADKVTPISQQSTDGARVTIITYIGAGDVIVGAEDDLDLDHPNRGLIKAGGTLTLNTRAALKARPVSLTTSVDVVVIREEWDD